jgi:hypothetical protein
MDEAYHSGKLDLELRWKNIKVHTFDDVGLASVECKCVSDVCVYMTSADSYIKCVIDVCVCVCWHLRCVCLIGCTCGGKKKVRYQI